MSLPSLGMLLVFPLLELLLALLVLMSAMTLAVLTFRLLVTEPLLSQLVVPYFGGIQGLVVFAFAWTGLFPSPHVEVAALLSILMALVAFVAAVKLKGQ